MVLTHCKMGWIVLTVLSLSLPVWSAVKVIQPYKVVSTNGTAQIQCIIQPRPSFQQSKATADQTPRYPYSDPEELRVTLLKGLHGSEQLCSSILNLTEQTETGVEQEGEVQCSAQAADGAVEVTVSGLKATDTDMYRCEIQVFYPPPYLRLTGNGTLLHVLDSCPVQGAQRQTPQQGEEEEEEDERRAPVSVPVVVLVIVILCVLVIIIYFQTLQYQRGRREMFRTAPGVLHKLDAASFPCEIMA